MRFYFNVRCNGLCHRDPLGVEFSSLADARNYVRACAKICVEEGNPEEIDLLSRCLVEVSDGAGHGEIITMADALRAYRKTPELHNAS